MKSNSRYIAVGLGVLVAIAGGIPAFAVMFGGDDSSFIDSSILMTEVAFFVAILAALYSAVNGMLQNPGGVKNALIGVGALVVVLGISYVLADGSDYELYKSDEETSKMVSVGLNAFYIMFLLTIVSVAYSAVARIFK